MTLIVQNIFGLSFVAALGGYTLWVGFSFLKKKRMLVQVPTSKVYQIKEGNIELSGKAEGEQIVKAPFSNRDCLIYECTVEKRIPGKNRIYKTAAKSNNFSTPLYLSDETGKILLDLKNAEFSNRDEWEFYDDSTVPLPPQLMQFMEQECAQHKNLIGSSQLLFVETIIPLGGSIFVAGNAKRVNGDLVVTKGKSPFMVTNYKEKDLTALYGDKSLLAIIFGALLLTSCLVYLYILLT